MNIYEIANMEQNISIDTNNKELISLDDSLMQELVDMKVEIFLNKSAQYLLSMEKKNVSHFA